MLKGEQRCDLKDRGIMTELIWGETKDRIIETGIDRGVLYIDGFAYPWNGLVSIKEDSNGGEAQGYYIDGIKYANISSYEEFKAVLTAFNAPDAFSSAEGVVRVSPGLFAAQQPRHTFGLSYRTLLTNPEGIIGYKIHLVYNCIADPSGRVYETVDNKPEATELSWSISTLPPIVTGIRPTAHFTIDTTKMAEPLVTSIENVLYGTTTQDASLPSAPNLVDMVKNYV